MNENLEQKLIEYMDKTAGAVEKVAELSMEQAPLIVKEYIMWGIVSGVYSFFAYIFLIVLACVGLKILWKVTEYEPKGRFNDGFGYQISRVIGGGVIALFISINAHAAFSNLEKAIKAYAAPRVYVIDKLRGAK